MNKLYLLVLLLVFVACSQTPDSVEVTTIVERAVEVTTVVEREIQVTTVVEREVEVTTVVEREIEVTQSVEEFISWTIENLPTFDVVGSFSQTASGIPIEGNVNGVLTITELEFTGDSVVMKGSIKVSPKQDITYILPATAVAPARLPTSTPLPTFTPTLEATASAEHTPTPESTIDVNSAELTIEVQTPVPPPESTYDVTQTPVVFGDVLALNTSGLPPSSKAVLRQVGCSHVQHVGNVGGWLCVKQNGKDLVNQPIPSGTDVPFAVVIPHHPYSDSRWFNFEAEAFGTYGVRLDNFEAGENVFDIHAQIVAGSRQFAKGQLWDYPWGLVNWQP